MYVLVIKPRRDMLEDSKGIPQRVINTPHKEHTEFVDNTVSEHDEISYAKESIEIKRKADKPEGIDDIDSIHDNDTKSLHNRTHFNSKLEMNTNDNDSLKLGQGSAAAFSSFQPMGMMAGENMNPENM